MTTPVVMEGQSLGAELEARGITRRTFLTFCASMTAVLALPSAFNERIARALETSEKPSLIWLEFQDCAGNTESFLRAHDPGVADIVLDILSVDYHETIMAAAGIQAEAAKRAALDAGGHIVVVEGSVPLADGGVYCTIGGKTAQQHLEEAADGAAAIINVGTCSSFGGIPAASPNPTGALGVPEVIKNVPIINLPGCPMNVDNLLGVIAHYLTFGALPPTDGQGRPLFAYGQRIHDNCERRAHFDAGQFALEWGDEGHRKGWCLYRLGCKGPSTFHNCPSVQWNMGTSWPVGAGHGCVGCSEADFWDNMSPFYERLPKPPGFGVTTTVEQIGLGVVAATAIGFGAHGVAKIIQHQRSGEAQAPPVDTGEPDGGE
ncbi:MAG TPA: hydrogenase small subunit [Acidimicrobiia bacterium]|nr:hydrogenase small subunit [Acidimicrobiia bacterium]